MLKRCFGLLSLLLLGGSSILGQIRVDSKFESGKVGEYIIDDSSNIVKIVSASDPLNPIDTLLAPSSRWYYFKLTGVKDKMVSIEIKRSECIRPFYSYDNINFFRFDSTECNSSNGTVTKFFYYDTVYISHFIPYTLSRLNAKIVDWSKKSDKVISYSIGKSLDNRDITILEITNNKKQDSSKKRVWIHGRSHPSESPSSYHLEFLIDKLLDSSKVSDELLDNTIFYVVPMINPDGVFGGYSRSTSSGVNMEINWDKDSTQTIPEVNVLKKKILEIVTSGHFDLFLNMHSQIANSVTYWIHTWESTNRSFLRRQLLLSNLTANNNQHYSYKDQSFSSLANRYAEGWIWKISGDKSIAITFETPYTFYKEDPSGDWVSLKNLEELALNSFYSIYDFLTIKGSNRAIYDSDEVVYNRRWNADTSNSSIYFGNSVLNAKKRSATLKFKANSLERLSEYLVYKWEPGRTVSDYQPRTNIWKSISTTKSDKKGRVKFIYSASKYGNNLDALLFQKKLP